MVLEFASSQPPALAREFLGEMAHILQVIFSALRQRDSALRQPCSPPCWSWPAHKAEAVPFAADEPLDDSWAEPVVFDGCSSRGQAAPGQPQPIQIVRQSRRTALRSRV